jgi:hypothetical protein
MGMPTWLVAGTPLQSWTLSCTPEIHAFACLRRSRVSLTGSRMASIADGKSTPWDCFQDRAARERGASLTHIPCNMSDLALAPSGDLDTHNPWCAERPHFCFASPCMRASLFSLLLACLPACRPAGLPPDSGVRPQRLLLSHLSRHRGGGSDSLAAATAAGLLAPLVAWLGGPAPAGLGSTAATQMLPLPLLRSLEPRSAAPYRYLLALKALLQVGGWLEKVGQGTSRCGGSSSSAGREM